MTEPIAARRIPYDLDRAARAGGFDDDLETGREVARRLHAVMVAQMPLGADARTIVTMAIHEIADLWEGDATANTMWLANMFRDMLRDLSSQISEARGLRTDGRGNHITGAVSGNVIQAGNIDGGLRL